MGTIFRVTMKKIITNAVKALEQGKLIVFPTETVYGLGADASNSQAVQKIFETKKRPTNHPLIVHIGHQEEMTYWGQDLSPLAHKLAELFWPGPLTLIVKKQSHVLDAVTGGQSTVGLRVPSHPIALELLNAFQGGIAAPSANLYGYISPTRAKHVKKDLGNAVEMILNGGNCAIGIESTIIDVTGELPVIRRLGSLTEKIRHYFKQTGIIEYQTSCEEISQTRVPGQVLNHYAPKAPLYLLSQNDIQEIALHFSENSQKKCFILSFNAPNHNYSHKNITYINMPLDSEHYAACLYHTLREIDEKKPDVILVEKIPEEKNWEAIAERLEKARCKTVNLIDNLC